MRLHNFSASSCITLFFWNTLATMFHVLHYSSETLLRRCFISMQYYTTLLKHSCNDVSWVCNITLFFWNTLATVFHHYAILHYSSETLLQRGFMSMQYCTILLKHSCNDVSWACNITLLFWNTPTTMFHKYAILTIMLYLKL